MSESTRVDEAAKSGQINGRSATYGRIADLLDDVTVGGVPGIVRPSVPQPSGLQPALPQQAKATASPLPGEPFRAGQRTALPASPSPSVTNGQPALPAETLPPPEPAPSPGAEPPLLTQPSAPHHPVLQENATNEPEPIRPPPHPTVPSFDGAQAATGPLLNIKGRSEGIAVEIGKGNWNEILAVLAERLQAADRFFRHGRVALDSGPRPVTETELHQLAAVLASHEMTLAIVRTSAEHTFQAALALGLAATLESVAGTPMAAATPAETNSDAASYFVYRGYLRSGHRLWRQENILVIGDINPGAEVISQGDILVWGRLRGRVQAGAGGDKRAIVAALDLEPTQLRIADVTTIAPDPKPGQPARFFWRRSPHKRPEIARIVAESIVLEEWDTARPGGLVSLRRSTG